MYTPSSTGAHPFSKSIVNSEPSLRRCFGLSNSPRVHTRGLAAALCCKHAELSKSKNKSCVRFQGMGLRWRSYASCSKSRREWKSEQTLPCRFSPVFVRRCHKIMRDLITFSLGSNGSCAAKAARIAGGIRTRSFAAPRPGADLTQV
jgi:hypothetical protein